MEPRMSKNRLTLVPGMKKELLASKINEEHEYFQHDKALFPFLHDRKSLPFGSTIVCKWHERMELKYILSGQTEIACGSNIICAKQGDIVIINPCERHMTRVESPSAEYHLLMVDISTFLTIPWLRNGFEGYEDGVFGFCNVIRNDDKTAKIMSELCEAIQLSTEDSQFEAYGLFLLLFGKLKSCYVNPAYRRPNNNPRNYSLKQESVIAGVMSYIYEHYSEPMHLADMAALHYITEAHLCRMFRRVMGQSPFAYIMEFRVNKAAMLLETTEISLMDIANRTGFRDTAYFNRCFRKHKGIPPGLYRAQNNKSLSLPFTDELSNPLQNVKNNQNDKE